MWFIPIVFLTEYDGIRAFSCSANLGLTSFSPRFNRGLTAVTPRFNRGLAAVYRGFCLVISGQYCISEIGVFVIKRRVGYRACANWKSRTNISYRI